MSSLHLVCFFTFVATAADPATAGERCNVWQPESQGSKVLDQLLRCGPGVECHAVKPLVVIMEEVHRALRMGVTR